MMQLVKDVARFASSTKTIQTRSLNVLGAQVVRTCAARLVYNVRPGPGAGAMSGALEDLKMDGVAVVPDFLDAEHFVKVREECERVVGGDSDKLIRKTDGTNSITLAMIGDFAGSLPETGRFYADPRLHAVFLAAEKRKLEPSLGHCMLELLVQGPEEGPEDTQTELHSDTFFNTFKAWLYLHDVATEDGPLVYVKGSHRLSAKQLSFVYRESCNGNRGSRRIKGEELERLGSREAALTCPANTLVIANTFGYHRRLRGQPGRRRLALHVNVRTRNPFALIG